MLRNVVTHLLRNKSKMVIVVRSDLNMGKGKIASQAAHAAIALYQSAIKSSNPNLNSWLLSGQPKVVLKVDSEEALQNLYSHATNTNLTCCTIYDAGRTQIESGTLTAVGIGPNLEDQVDSLTKQFKLL